MNQKIKNDCEAAELKTQVNVTTIEQNLQAPGGITPYKLSILFKHADRIIHQLTNIPQWLATYDDIEFVLEMVLTAVRKAKGGDKDAVV